VIRRARRLPLLFVAVLLVGCAAAAPATAPEQRSSSPRVRCLSDPGRDASQGTRPLFFLFCIESP